MISDSVFSLYLLIFLFSGTSLSDRSGGVGLSVESHFSLTPRCVAFRARTVCVYVEPYDVRHDMKPNTDREGSRSKNKKEDPILITTWLFGPPKSTFIHSFIHSFSHKHGNKSTRKHRRRTATTNDTWTVLLRGKHYFGASRTADTDDDAACEQIVKKRETQTEDVFSARHRRRRGLGSVLSRVPGSSRTRPMDTTMARRSRRRRRTVRGVGTRETRCDFVLLSFFHSKPTKGIPPFETKSVMRRTDSNSASHIPLFSCIVFWGWRQEPHHNRDDERCQSPFQTETRGDLQGRLEQTSGKVHRGKQSDR